MVFRMNGVGLSHSEISARGGRSRSEKKLAASHKNLERARAAAAEKNKALARGLPWDHSRANPFALCAEALRLRRD